MQHSHRISDRNEIEENIRKHRMQEVLRQKQELENKLRAMENELKNLGSSAKPKTKLSPGNKKIMISHEEKKNF